MSKVCLIRLRGSNVSALSDLAERLGKALTDAGRRVAILEKCAAPEAGTLLFDASPEGQETIHIRTTNQPGNPGMISVDFHEIPSGLDEASIIGRNHSSTDIADESRPAVGIYVSADDADQAVRSIIGSLDRLNTISGPRDGYTREEEDLVARRLKELGYL